MAHIDLSYLYNIQTRIAQDEFRAGEYGVIGLAKKSTAAFPLLSPELRNYVATLEGRSIDIPALTKDTITVTTSESYTIPEHLSVSAVTSFSLVKIFSGFRVYPQNFVNNMISEQQYTENKMLEVMEAMANEKESQILTVLSNRKSQVVNGVTQINGGDGTFTYQGATDQLDLDKASQKDMPLTNLTKLMQINKFRPPYSLVANTGGLNLSQNEILKYGAQNSKDLTANNRMPIALFESNNISAGSDQFVGYLIKDGAIAVMQNYPSNFRNGLQIGSKRFSVMDMPAPFVGEPLNVFYNEDTIDASAVGTTTGHMAMSWYKEYAFLDSFVIFYSYNSAIASNANDIIKLVGKTS